MKADCSVHLKLEKEYHDRYLKYCKIIGASKIDLMRYMLDLIAMMNADDETMSDFSNVYKHWLRERVRNAEAR